MGNLLRAPSRILCRKEGESREKKKSGEKKYFLVFKRGGPEGARKESIVISEEGRQIDTRALDKKIVLFGGGGGFTLKEMFRSHGGKRCKSGDETGTRFGRHHRDRKPQTLLVMLEGKRFAEEREIGGDVGGNNGGEGTG